MQSPIQVTSLLKEVFSTLIPIIDRELKGWREKAEAIPDEELRSQAIASIASKAFHCRGGGVFSLLAGEKRDESIRFIVAYQTISDYLDNLCDRSTSLDPKDFRLLHQAMKDALTPGASVKNYYSYRAEQDDGGYLAELVQTCQDILREVEGYEGIQDTIVDLEELYADLQVYKHVRVADRMPHLIKWYSENKQKALGLSWYEFAAASGSTLGIFCLVSYALAGKMTDSLTNLVVEAYFPSIQALHILLDYYIDQHEDEMEGDLNFCSYYRDHVQLLERLQYFLLLAEDRVAALPDAGFHQFIPKGLVALYLSDQKVKTLEQGNHFRKSLLKTSGMTGKILHYNIRMYNKLSEAGRSGANFV